jgi:Tfp pilus assembly protein PilX
VIRLLRAIRARDDERGVALAAVVLIGMVVMLLVATMVAVSTSGARVTSTDTAWNRAIAAAYSGVADYQSRLNADNTYGTYGQANAPFSAASTGSSFPRGTGGNPAFNYQSGTAWVAVPTADGSASDASFRYAVDNSKLSSQGVIRLQSTGRAGNTTRTVVANVRPDGFSNYLYFTNYESGDPTVTNEKGTLTAPCTSAYRPAATSTTCDQIQFGQNDVLEGPVRSNDQIKACGATFKSTFQSVYGWTSANCGTAAAKFASNPTTVSTLTPPSTIGDLRDSMRSDLPATTDTVEGTGCLYTGPTKITFNGNGTMTVLSPLTIRSNVTGATATPGALITGAPSQPDKCGRLADLRSTVGATVPIPKNNMVFVQNEPSARAAGTTQDPNYWKGNAETKTLPTACDAAGTASQWTSSKANGVGYPYVGNSSTTSEADPTAGAGANVVTPYGCDRGDAFVQGTVDKAVTVAAENYVYVTGDVKYPSTRSPSTVLGLIGQRAVWVWNPVNSAGNPILPANREVDAAILSNLGTFVVQNWTRGSTAGRGTLTVSGSIAQNFRGAVGLASGQGFDKDYRFDSSLATYTPPKFPQPTVTTYRVATQVESKTAYDANGAPVS